MTCKYCDCTCKKDGKQKNGNQKYKCKSCGKYQQFDYTYKACIQEIRNQFRRMNRLGCGIRKMAVFLRISINTVQKWIYNFMHTEPEKTSEFGGVYDIDEIQTFVAKRSNKIWITYAWDVHQQKAIALHVGGRSSVDLGHVTSKVLALAPSQVNTDNYSAYPNLLKGILHKKGKRKANHIERQHLNLRKDISCLIRETMCFAKKTERLEARLKWCFWGENYSNFSIKNN